MNAMTAAQVVIISYECSLTIQARGVVSELLSSAAQEHTGKSAVTVPVADTAASKAS
jgi:hypothetical protein